MLGPYFSLQEELSHQDGRVFRGERAFIIDTPRSDFASQLHYLVSAYIELESVCISWA